MIFLEFIFSLFDAVLCVYFITRFNHASISVRKNRFIIPAVAVIFAFSVINDILLSGFNIIGTVIFLALYIGYALLISGKKYTRALLSACIFEIIFVLLSSLLFFIISLIIEDDSLLSQGTYSTIRLAYVIMHKIALFVCLKLILMLFRSDESFEAKHAIIAFLFSFATILGLGSTMYLASISSDESIQIHTSVITVAFTFANLALYLLIFQMQRYQRSKYELKLLQEKMAYDEARHNDAAAIWSRIRQAQHDMKQHLAVISGYAKNGDLDGCSDYIAKLSPDIVQIGSLIRSDNEILDYLINTKLGSLTDTKIVISGSVGDLSDIRDLDLVCLIGNILDNATEALDKVHRVSEKRIELLFLRQNSNRIIICKNTIEKSVLADNNELLTTKINDGAHGYGTKIIAKIVSDYNGMVDYFEEFGMFGVQVVLPEPSAYVR